MSDEYNYVGNISTIVKILSMALAGWFLGIIASYGLDLPVNAAMLSELISSLIFVVLAFVDAKNPNSFKFLGNDNAVDMGTVLGYPKEETVLNDDYVSDDSEADVSDEGV